MYEYVFHQNMETALFKVHKRCLSKVNCHIFRDCTTTDEIREIENNKTTENKTSQFADA